MQNTRREFLRDMSSVAAVGVFTKEMRLAEMFVPPDAGIVTHSGTLPDNAETRELTQVALDAAKAAGATYADVRIAATKVQSIQTRENRVDQVNERETFGFGVRVLANGAWGFSASNVMTRDNVAKIARMAVDEAKANSVLRRNPVTLAPITPVPDGTWRTPIQVDPFTIPIADKVGLLLAANAAALKVNGAKYVSSNMFFQREEKTLATSDGSYIVQTLYRTLPSMTVTAVSSDTTDFQSRSSTDIAPMGRGYEHVTEAKLEDNARRWAQEAVEKLSAKSVMVGRYDLVLDPTHLWLTIHESIAHPTELDRVYGYEANFAGTSFVAPPEKVLGKLKYGSPLLNVMADRSQPGSLSAIGWDDEGVKPDDFHLVKDGILVDYQTTREEAVWLDWWYKSQGKETRSHGCSYAQSWQDVQFQRMPNVSLMPGEKDLSWNDLIAATENGIAIVGSGSFSIDQQRYNAQFGGQLFYEIKGGKITGMLRDVAYHMRTPQFWASLDMIGGKSSYFLGGAFADGKGEPMQINAVSHGCVPARFLQASVINTGRKV